MKPTYKKIHGVFEGGGVKGSGLIGALKVTQEHGYWFENVAGTSAGAIVAALVAAGYSADEINTEILNLDYRSIRDPGVIGRIPLVGPALNLLLRDGIYKGLVFEGWLRGLLEKKNVRTFGDLICHDHPSDPACRYRLQVVASDITRGKFLILPKDIELFGIKPEDLDVARAVRMSMSIPYFFEPVILTENLQSHYVVDGGILSNYPVWLFDDAKYAKYPTVGYKLVEPDVGKPHQISGPIDLFKALFATMMEAHDARYVEDSDFRRTIPIPTLGVQTTDFDIAREEKMALHKSGVEAAEKFFMLAGANLLKPA